MSVKSCASHQSLLTQKRGKNCYFQTSIHHKAITPCHPDQHPHQTCRIFSKDEVKKWELKFIILLNTENIDLGLKGMFGMIEWYVCGVCSLHMQFTSHPLNVTLSALQGFFAFHSYLPHHSFVSQVLNYLFSLINITKIT